MGVVSRLGVMVKLQEAGVISCTRREVDFARESLRMEGNTEDHELLVGVATTALATVRRARLGDFPCGIGSDGSLVTLAQCASVIKRNDP